MTASPDSEMHCIMKTGRERYEEGRLELLVLHGTFPMQVRACFSFFILEGEGKVCSVVDQFKKFITTPQWNSMLR